MTSRGTSCFRWMLALCAVFAVLLVFGFLSLDQSVVQLVRDGAGKSLKNLARGFSRYGDFPWLLGAGLVSLAFCLRFERREWARIFTAMLIAGVVAGLASNVIKLGAGRARPRVEIMEPGWYGPVHQGEWISLRSDFQGFPSSHAACAFGFFFPLFLSRRALGAAGLIAAAAVAWSRVQLNAHHVSDVAAGALIGVLAGWLVWRWIFERGGLARWLGERGV